MDPFIHASRNLSYIIIIAGAPLEISEDLVTTFNISLVVRGTISETSVDPKEQQAKEERYKAPKEAKIFRCGLFVLVSGPKPLWSDTLCVVSTDLIASVY